MSRGVFHLVALSALCLCAPPVLATHYVVDLNGGGDFTTIQAAIDQRAIEFRDTIVVLAGGYDETLVLSPVPQQAYIVGAGGASVTSIRTVVPPAAEFAETRIEGFTLTQSMTNTGSPRSHYFSRCMFLGSVSSFGEPGEVNYRDCDFYGRTFFHGYRVGLGQPPSPPFEELRFHGTTLVIGGNGGGGSAMRNCTFEGPADTLVYKSDCCDPVNFGNCRFSNAKHGLVLGHMMMGGGDIVGGCSFVNLTENGILLGEVPQGAFEADRWVADSRFEDCGTAVRWVAPAVGPSNGITLLRDTILTSRSDGVVIGRHWGGGVFNSIITGSGGHGVVFLQDSTDYSGLPVRAVVEGSTITNNAGDGVRVQGSSAASRFDPQGLNFPRPVITNSLIARNGGAGLRVVAPTWDVRGCVAIVNGSDGIACSTTVAIASSQLASNTSVFNGGEGFHVEGPTASGDSLRLVRNNLAAMNSRSGFNTPSSSSGSFAFNDSWGNYLTQYVGAWASLDSNLTVDPRFCDLGAGDLGLQQGSPCGPPGVYGLIGALPESCPSTLTVEPPAPGALTFAVRPSIARGSADFVPPATGAEGVVELFDLAGRIVWRAPLGPATGVIRWRGEGESGRVRAGLYWARFTRGSERAMQRLVWLE